MKMQMYIVFVVCVYMLNCIVALSYSDLDAIEFENCPHKNRCSLLRSAPFNERLCECDDSCMTFRDCCIDAVQSRAKSSFQTCMHYGNFTHQGLYVFNSCSKGFLGPDEVIRQCMYDNFSDPLISAPVTDISSGKTYLNRYCAICNDVSPASMKIWKIFVACDDEDLDENGVTWDDIKYRSDLKKWGYDRYGEFNPCKLIYDRPRHVSIISRPCRSNLISSCARNWNRPTNRRECEAYMAVVTDRDNNAYKNPHCAKCNGVKDNDLKCLITTITDRTRMAFSFALLVDINSSDGCIVGVSRSSSICCRSGEIYDPFFNKCRTRECGLPGYVPVKGKCVKL